MYLRGSGQVLGASAEYRAIAAWAKSVRGLRLGVIDVPYPATGIDWRIGIKAFISSGRHYEYAKSVKDGIHRSVQYYQDITRACPSSKIAVLGYSQGAQVAGRAMLSLSDTHNLLYLALFGDPELYLPEGIKSRACTYGQKSPYRVDVPNCRVNAGVLGARIPYLNADLDKKSGLWCNESDFICGSSLNPTKNEGHFSYVSAGKLQRALAIIQSKMLESKRLATIKVTTLKQDSAMVSSRNSPSPAMASDQELKWGFWGEFWQYIWHWLVH